MKSVRRRAALGALVTAVAASLAVVAPLAGTASASPGLVQTASAGAPVTSSTTVSWPSATTPGNLLLLTVQVKWHGFTGTVSVPAGWALAHEVEYRSGTTALYYRENAPSQSGAVTVSVNQPTYVMNAILAEYDGVAHTNSIDQRAAAWNTQGADAMSGTTPVTTQPNTLWVSVITSYVGLYACAPTNGFSLVNAKVQGDGSVTMFHRTDGTSGAASMSASMHSGSCSGQLISYYWTGLIVTFRTPAAACPATQPGVDVCLTPGELVGYATLRSSASGAPADIAGYVDGYEFTVAGASTVLPCVHLVSGSTTVNPCALAGGRFVSRYAELVESSDPGPTLPAPLVSVGVCQATLTVTVAGLGVRSAPAYTLC